MTSAIGLGQHVSCDSCMMNDLALRCPGVLAHCTCGEHCTTVMEVCALDAAAGHHGYRCCHCLQHLQAGRR